MRFMSVGRLYAGFGGGLFEVVIRGSSLRGLLV